MGITTSSFRISSTGNALSNSSASMQAGYFGSVNLNSGAGSFLSITNNDNLTVPRTLGIIVDNGNRILTIGGDSTISGLNSGDQEITINGDINVGPMTNGTYSSTLSNSGINAGTWTKVTFNGKGIATVGDYLTEDDIPLLLATKISDFDTQVRSSQLDQMAVPTTSVSLNSQKITNLADPEADTDAVNKGYVDAVAQGLDVKLSVRAATVEPISLTGEQNIDGIDVISGDRILVKNQSQAKYNGIYVADSNGWSRASDANSSKKVTSGMFTFVEEGIQNMNIGFVLATSSTITLGTTALNFAQFSKANDIIAGDGLVKTGLTLDIGTASSSRIVINSNNIDLAKTSVVPGSYGSVSKTVSITVDDYGRISSIGENSIGLGFTPADDTLIVHLSGTETITGEKTFTTSPKIPTADNNDNSTNAASTAYVDNAVSNSTTRYVTLFNATTDWGDISNGLYSISINQSTHKRGTDPIIQILRKETSTRYSPIIIEDIDIFDTGNITFSIPATPEGRFEGKIVIL